MIIYRIIVNFIYGFCNNIILCYLEELFIGTGTLLFIILNLEEPEGVLDLLPPGVNANCGGSFHALSSFPGSKLQIINCKKFIKR